MNRALMPMLMLLAGACQPTEKNFTEKYITAYCDYEKRCNAAAFFYAYDDKGDCLDKQEEYYAAFGGKVPDGCTFDEDKAAECLDALNQSCKEIGDDLDEFDPDCDEAVDCGDLYGG